MKTTSFKAVTTGLPAEDAKSEVPVRAVLLDWALGYLEAGRYEEAEMALAEIGRVVGSEPICWAGAGVAAALGGSPERARAHLAELEARHPKSPLRQVLRSFVNQTFLT